MSKWLKLEKQNYDSNFIFDICTFIKRYIFLNTKNPNYPSVTKEYKASGYTLCIIFLQSAECIFLEYLFIYSLYAVVKHARHSLKYL